MPPVARRSSSRPRVTIPPGRSSSPRRPLSPDSPGRRLTATSTCTTCSTCSTVCLRFVWAMRDMRSPRARLLRTARRGAHLQQRERSSGSVPELQYSGGLGELHEGSWRSGQGWATHAGRDRSDRVPLRLPVRLRRVSDCSPLSIKPALWPGAVLRCGSRWLGQCYWPTSCVVSSRPKPLETTVIPPALGPALERGVDLDWEIARRPGGAGAPMRTLPGWMDQRAAATVARPSSIRVCGRSEPCSRGTQPRDSDRPACAARQWQAGR